MYGQKRTGHAVRLGARLTEILLCILLAWLCAHGVWSVVLGPVVHRVPTADVMAPTDRVAPVADYNSIAEFDPFVGHNTVVVEKDVEIFEDVRPTDLNITLHGVWAQGEPSARSAIIQAENEKQRLYYIGDTIGDAESTITLTDVFNTYAIISRNGTREKLLLIGRKIQEGSTGNIHQHADTKISDSPDVDASSSSFFSGTREGVESFSSQVQIRILRDDHGQKKSYALYPKNAGTLFAQAGLMSGDVLKKLNGQPVPNSPERFLDILSDLPADKSVLMEVERDGHLQEIKIKLTDFSN